MRQYTLFDQLIGHVDQAVSTVFGEPVGERKTPAEMVEETPLSADEKRHSAGLMRVDHSGEVCAQALYLGQAITARDPKTREAMEQASKEENDHLDWCRQRLDSLGSHTSYLNPLWYAGSFVMGMCAGIVGDRWSLGFVAETERQVTEHLESHLHELPPGDKKSAAVLQQMREDEAKHATMAVQAGAAPLPPPITGLMRCLSKVMTTIAYRI